MEFEKQLKEELCEKKNGLLYWRNYSKGNFDLISTPQEVKTLCSQTIEEERSRIEGKVKELKSWVGGHRKWLGDAFTSERVVEIDVKDGLFDKLDDRLSSIQSKE